MKDDNPPGIIISYPISKIEEILEEAEELIEKIKSGIENE